MDIRGGIIMTEQVKTPKDKWELQVTDTIKIQQFDDKNFVIQQLKEVTHPKTRETIQSYINQGYFPTVSKALDGILNKDLMVDLNRVSELKDYVRDVRKAKAYIRDLMENL